MNLFSFVLWLLDYLGWLAAAAAPSNNIIPMGRDKHFYMAAVHLPQQPIDDNFILATPRLAGCGFKENMKIVEMK